MALTVTGTILDIDGSPLFAEVLATPLSTPIMKAAGTIISKSTSTVKTNPNTGYWSMVLEQGDYTITFSYNNSLSPTTIQISVPAGSGTTTVDLLVTSALVYTSAIPVQNYTAGTYSISSGASSGSVSGLALTFSPRLVLLTVSSPPNGLTLVACVVGPTTNDGWSFAMNGAADSAGYQLNWIAIP